MSQRRMPLSVWLANEGDPQPGALRRERSTSMRPFTEHDDLGPDEVNSSVVRAAERLLAGNPLSGTATRATSGKARAQDAFWIRVARLVEGEDSTAAGVTVGMLGAQRERVRIPAEVAGLSLDAELAKAVAYLAGDGKRRVLIHVDNVENLARADAPAAAGLMQDVRDALLVDGSHWRRRSHRAACAGRGDVRGLRRLGKAVVLVRYEGEEPSSWKLALREAADYWNRIFRWVDEHLRER